MAVIAKTAVIGSGQLAVTVTTLSASDTLEFTPNVNSTLILNNVSGGALTPLIVGADATTAPCSGIGNIDVSGGVLLTSIGIGATVAVPLDSISSYLKGVITVTGGDAIEAQLLEYA
jgi:hypothetical protein